MDKEERFGYVPVLIVLGQSNAHGHGTIMPEPERMITPLKNVFGLRRAENQSYDVERVIWSGYTSTSMNLGENQEHTYCLATEFARLWQKEAELLQLPDLYIIQISIGGQGINEYEKFGNMWYPNRPKVIKAGDLDSVDISLYPLAIHILTLAMESIRKRGKRPQILGLHWNQWESEVDTGGDAMLHAKEHYQYIFNGFRDAIKEPFNIFLYKPLSGVYENPDGLAVMNRIFEELVDGKEITVNEESGYRLIDPSNYPGYNERIVTKGIFQEDRVHYTGEVQKWFAKEEFDRIKTVAFCKRF